MDNNNNKNVIIFLEWKLPKQNEMCKHKMATNEEEKKTNLLLEEDFKKGTIKKKETNVFKILKMQIEKSEPNAMKKLCVNKNLFTFL